MADRRAAAAGATAFPGPCVCRSPVQAGAGRDGPTRRIVHHGRPRRCAVPTAATAIVLRIGRPAHHRPPGCRADTPDGARARRRTGAGRSAVLWMKRAHRAKTLAGMPAAARGPQGPHAKKSCERDVHGSPPDRIGSGRRRATMEPLSPGVDHPTGRIGSRPARLLAHPGGQAGRRGATRVAVHRSASIVGKGPGRTRHDWRSVGRRACQPENSRGDDLLRPCYLHAAPAFFRSTRSASGAGGICRKAAAIFAVQNYIS